MHSLGSLCVDIASRKAKALSSFIWRRFWPECEIGLRSYICELVFKQFKSSPSLDPFLLHLPPVDHRLLSPRSFAVQA